MPSGENVNSQGVWEGLGQELAFGFPVQKGEGKQDTYFYKFVNIMKEYRLAKGKIHQCPSSKTRGHSLQCKRGREDH